MNRALASSLVLLLLVIAAWISSGCQGSGHDSSSQQQDENAQLSNAEQDQEASGPAPKIEFEEMSYDFGTVPQQSSVSHTFKVKNVGDAPLTLIRAKAG